MRFFDMVPSLVVATLPCHKRTYKFDEPLPPKIINKLKQPRLFRQYYTDAERLEESRIEMLVEERTGAELRGKEDGDWMCIVVLRETIAFILDGFGSLLELFGPQRRQPCIKQEINNKSDTVRPFVHSISRRTG